MDNKPSHLIKHLELKTPATFSGLRVTPLNVCRRRDSEDCFLEGAASDVEEIKNGVSRARRIVAADVVEVHRIKYEQDRYRLGEKMARTQKW